MFWADKAARQLSKTGPHLVDDMKTPSGRIHVGSLRGVIIHDLIFRALKDVGVSVRYTYIFDDHDVMDALPTYLPKEKFGQYMGFPLNKVPSPEPGFANFAHFYALEFKKVFVFLGAKPEIIWASQLYQSGKMNQGIKKCLDGAAKIRKIYKKVAGADLSDDWFPFFVICPECGRVGTTRVYDWDGKKVAFKCEPEMVAWAKGCGHDGKISPFDGRGKLAWKVEWAVKWQALGVTVEGAGKDHMSAGGSHDITSAVCREVLDYPVPYPIPYEFFLIGGKKMSSSKGLGSSAAEVAKILPPEILRFLMVRIPYRRAIDFDPGGMTIPDLFDDYDRAAKIYWKRGKSDDFGRIFELSQPSGKPPKLMFLPRFRDVAMVAQMPNVEPEKYFAEQKGKALDSSEKKTLAERVKYAKIWLDGYAPEEMVFKVRQKLPDEAEKLTRTQKAYLAAVAKFVSKKQKPEVLEKKLYEAAKEHNLASAKAFQAIYLALLGKPYGPKAAWLLSNQDLKFVQKRFEEVQ